MAPPRDTLAPHGETKTAAKGSRLTDRYGYALQFFGRTSSGVVVVIAVLTGAPAAVPARASGVGVAPPVDGTGALPQRQRSAPAAVSCGVSTSGDGSVIYSTSTDTVLRLQERRIDDVIFEDALNIYTDGSSFENPRRGGMGIRYIVVNVEGHAEIHDEMPTGYKQVTNNEMELLACVIALREIPAEFLSPTISRIVIFTDSQYVRNYYNRAVWIWPKQGWRNQHGRPIENVEIWKDLVKELKKSSLPVRLKWVKGHSQNVHNSAVDKLARKSANGYLNEPLTVTSVRRKKSDQSVSIGSVLMEGQELNIRIITDKRMRPQKVWRYKYEVLQCDSPYVGYVDIIYSEHLLRAGHSYRVQVSEKPMNPEVVEVIEELDLTDGEDS